VDNSQFSTTLDTLESDLQAYIDDADDDEDEVIDNDVVFNSQIPEIYNEIMDINDMTKKNSDMFASLEVAMHSCP